MKRKGEIVNLLDELRSQDPKKRFNSVQSIKQIATAIGPARVRTEFVQYLSEFIDDQQYIVLQLLNQLQDFAPLLGGEQHQKSLLPLLIGFCKTDEKKQAEKASQIILKIMPKNKQLIFEVIKKLNKTQMNTTKQSAAKLISNLIHLSPQNETQILQIFGAMVMNQNSSYKIIASRYIGRLLQNVKSKEQIGKFLEYIYNDSQDLPKIFALNALINFYTSNSNASMTKIKGLFVINSWRMNIKICQIIPLASTVFSKAHFKSTFESALVKCLTSLEPELRCKACLVLKPLILAMTEQDIKTKIVPIIKKLSQDSVDYVKVQMSKNIVSLLEVCSQSLINDEILPIIFNFIKNSQLAIGIVKQFQSMTKKVSSDILEEKILNPLVSQFNTDNWRVKCQLIELLGNVINSSVFLNDKLTSLLINLTADKINAVRQKATELIITIICQQSPQWCDNMMIPKLTKLRDSPSYIERQIMLVIIEKTADKISEKTLNEFYKSILMTYLSDKVPNVKARALKIIKSNKKLGDKQTDKYIERLKTDSDMEVRQLATMVKA